MKLGALNTAIRGLSSNPKIATTIPGGRAHLVLQKGPLIEELTRIYTEGRAQETGLRLDDEGFLARDPPDLSPS